MASGSLPPGVPSDFYQRVADICRELGVPLVLDTSGGGLAHITSGVFLLKPSVRELRECFGRELATESEQLAAAHELIDSGISQAVVVSLGANGALLATRHGSQRFPVASVNVVSGVGAGDAMVAAITVGVTRGWPLSKSVQFGVATGAAMLMTPGTALAVARMRNGSSTSRRSQRISSASGNRLARQAVHDTARHRPWSPRLRQPPLHELPPAEP